jgi:GntR family transcriptional regulator
VYSPYQNFQKHEPLYQFVQREIMDALSREEWRPGEAIPSEKRLCERFGVSVGTLRKAIDALVETHILIRQQGLGTFVASHSQPRHLFQFFNFSPHEGPRTYPEVRFLSLTSNKADKLSAEKLKIPVGADTFKIRNLLIMKGDPVIVDTLVLPNKLFRGMTEGIVRDRPGTLYNLYLERYGVNVIRIDERVRASAASATSAKLLGIKPGAPILEIRRIAFSFNQQPVEWRISHVNTNHYEYVHRDVLEH